MLEYRTLLRGSGLEGLPWVRWSAPEPAVARAEEATRREERVGAAPPRSRPLPRANESPSADEQAAAGLESDVSLAALMGVAAAVDHSRRPLLGRVPGPALRHFRAPDFARLEWADVIALRDEPAVAELRAAAGRHAREQAGPRRPASTETVDRLDAALRNVRRLVGGPAPPDATVELATLTPPAARRGTTPVALAPDATAVLVLVPSPARRA